MKKTELQLVSAKKNRHAQTQPARITITVPRLLARFATRKAQGPPHYGNVSGYIRSLMFGAAFRRARGKGVKP